MARITPLVLLMSGLVGLSRGEAPPAGGTAGSAASEPVSATFRTGIAAVPEGGPGGSEAPRAPGLGWQIAGGSAYGAGGLLLGGAAGAGLFAAGCYAWSEDCGFAGLFGAFAGAAFGFAGAFPLGVYRFGNDENAAGSLGWTYFSAALGSAAAFGTWAAITRLEDEDAQFQSVLLGMAGAPIGALIGYNLTRHAKSAPQVSIAPQPKGGWAGRVTWSFGAPR